MLYVRFKRGISGEESDFYGEIKNYNLKTKKWRIHYFESDCESEELNINDVLESLRDNE